MPAPAAVLDANVLFSAPLRDLLLELAVTGLFAARWSDAITREWTRALARARPDIRPAQLARLMRLMAAALPDAPVENAERLVPLLRLPDPDDRHVLAAAIESGSQHIVTFDLAGFPGEVLAPFGVVATHPDAFLCLLWERDPEGCLIALRAVRRRLKSPAMSGRDYIDTLRRHRLEKFAQRLRGRFAAL